MKITESQIKNLIQEELTRILEDRDSLPMHQAIQQRQYDVPEEEVDPRTGRVHYGSAAERAQAYGEEPEIDWGQEAQDVMWDTAHVVAPTSLVQLAQGESPGLGTVAADIGMLALGPAGWGIKGLRRSARAIEPTVQALRGTGRTVREPVDTARAMHQGSQGIRRGEGGIGHGISVSSDIEQGGGRAISADRDSQALRDRTGTESGRVSPTFGTGRPQAKRDDRIYRMVQEELDDILQSLSKET